jgi:hypothetical protein
MCGSRFLASCVVATFLAGNAGLGFAEQPAPAPRPAALTRFPDRFNGISGVARQSDGIAICFAHQNVFLSDGDYRRWSALPCPNDAIFDGGFVGGDLRRLFFLKADDGPGTRIWTIDAAGKTAVLERRFDIGALDEVAFVSKDVGVVHSADISRRELAITTDRNRCAADARPIFGRSAGFARTSKRRTLAYCASTWRSTTTCRTSRIWRGWSAYTWTARGSPTPDWLTCKAPENYMNSVSAIRGSTARGWSASRCSRNCGRWTFPPWALPMPG